MKILENTSHNCVTCFLILTLANIAYGANDSRSILESVVDFVYESWDLIANFDHDITDADPGVQYYWFYKEDDSAECVVHDDVRSDHFSKKPNIIFILADDWGYNDVGYHNKTRKTPNIDGLAESGLILEQSYASAWCSPSRAALLTGKYPHAIQMHKHVILANFLTGLGLDQKLLPEYLKELGYDTHLVGKWHLGNCHESYLPTRRGFDSAYGFMTSQITPYGKSLMGPPYAVDWFENDKPLRGFRQDQMVPFNGDLLLNRSIEIITSSNKNPFFLYLALPHVHWPVDAPLKYLDLYSDVKDEEQRRHLAMISHMDAMVGDIMDKLKRSGQYENSILVMMGDNGGYHSQWDWLAYKGTGSNYPLSGGKGNYLEGGTRVPTFIHSPLLKSTGISQNMIHISDWLPTLLRAAGVVEEEIAELDIHGVDQFDALFRGCKGTRSEFAYGFQTYLIDPDDPNSAYATGAVRLGKYKISNINETVGIPGPPCVSCITPLLPRGTFTVYDLSLDPFEAKDLFPELSKEDPPTLLNNLKRKFDVFAEQMGPDDLGLITRNLSDLIDGHGAYRTDFCNLDGTRRDNA